MECTQYLHEMSHISTFSYVLISHYSFTPPLKAANKSPNTLCPFPFFPVPQKSSLTLCLMQPCVDKSLSEFLTLYKLHFKNFSHYDGF